MTLKRTTIELDQELLAKAKRALGGQSTRATVEEALRRATAHAEDVHQMRADEQARFFDRLRDVADLDVLASEEMWQ